MNKILLYPWIIILSMLAFSCHEEKAVKRRDAFNGDYMSHVTPANFVSGITNPFLPFSQGSTFTYVSETEDGVETIEIEVLNETRVVMGITCTVVRDIVYVGDELVEDTFDWFAQDKDGNVWYMGEKVDNYEDGVLTDHYGSWEAGVDGAEPGIIMLAKPEPGLYYRQEHFVGAAEDQGEIVGENETVTVQAGTFTGCLKVRETNPLDPGFLEFKYYAKNIGLVKVEKILDPVDELEELTSFTIN